MNEAIDMSPNSSDPLQLLIFTLMINALVIAIGLFLALQLSKKRRPSVPGYFLLPLGAVALLFSIFFESSILAFIGLGLTFWGALLLYIKPTNYVKASLLDSTAIPSLAAIDRMIRELGIEGKAVYLPPRYLKEVKGGKVFIPKKKEIVIPPIEESAEEMTFSRNPEGLYLTPPGLSLANLYEEELGRQFAGVDIEYLQTSLPKLFIEDLEIAEDLEINIEGDKIHAKIAGSIYRGLHKEIMKNSPNICASLGCPLSSSIALAIARTTGKPVIMEDNRISEDGKNIESSYLILEGYVGPTLEEKVEKKAGMSLGWKVFTSASFVAVALTVVFTLYPEVLDFLLSQLARLLQTFFAIEAQHLILRIKNMQFPLKFWDVNMWLAVTGIILLTTVGLISPYYGRTNLTIEKARLKKIALILAILIIAAVIIRIYQITTLS